MVQCMSTVGPVAARETTSRARFTVFKTPRKLVVYRVKCSTTYVSPFCQGGTEVTSCHIGRSVQSSILLFCHQIDGQILSARAPEVNPRSNLASLAIEQKNASCLAAQRRCNLRPKLCGPSSLRVVFLIPAVIWATQGFLCFTRNYITSFTWNSI